MNDGTESLDLSGLEPDLQVAYHLQSALQLMRDFKPDVHPALARRWAIGITELEKVVAWWDYWITRSDPDTTIAA